MTNAEFEDIFREHKDAVYRFAWRMTGESSVAEDIAQDVFVTLWRGPDRYESRRGSLRSFLLGIARNLALKRWRLESRLEEFDESEDLHFVAQPVSLEGVEVAELVAHAVRSLPQLQREVLVLAEYEDLTLEEIAAVTHGEVGTVKSRLHRARENLRRMLAPLKSHYVRE